jgi:signal transduction histidine kinase/ligand-binding sensor domain-containing protein/DNA-binding response OmpR family regulator
MNLRFLFPVFLLAVFLSAQAQNSLTFHHFTTSDGLSQNSVQCIFQDSRGFIWIGTANDGLNKFDGYHFVTYKSREGDVHSLSNNDIIAIAEDREGNLWVGTSSGLNRLDPVTGRFHRYFHDSLNLKSLKHNRISSLLVDSHDNLWVGTYLGLQRFNRAGNAFEDYSAGMTLQDNREDHEVRCMAEDKQGNLWLAVWWGGLKKLDIRSRKYTEYYSDPKVPDGLRNNNVVSLCIDDHNNLWVGNFMGGIRKLSLTTGRFLPLKDPESSATVWSICCDKKGKVWYTRTGLGMADTQSDKFRVIDYSKNDPEGLSSGYHYSAYCDRSGILWFGSTEGLSVYNGFNRRFVPYVKLVDKKQRYYATTFYKDASQPFLWMGTFGNGLIRMNEKTGQYTRLLAPEEKVNTSPQNYITYICGDRKNQIWVATGNGIVIVDRATGAVRKHLYFNSVKATIGNNVRGGNGFMYLESDSTRIIDVLRDKEYAFPSSGAFSLPSRVIMEVWRENDSILWIGTTGGLVRAHMHSHRLEAFSLNAKSANVNDKYIRSLYCDGSRNLWVGTQNGLYRYNPQSNAFVHYKSGFISQMILNIAEDSKGNLWLYTEKGVSKFNTKTRQIRNYDEEDGLKTDGVVFVASDGTFYLNRSREGYYRFHPDSIRDDANKPLVYFTRFLLFNKEVPVSSAENETPLKSDILNAPEIVLKHNQSVMSFEFTALNFTLPEKSRFAYKLEGFDRGWYETDAAHRMATYTNLNPGVYTFRVRASSSDGIWSDQSADLKIRILPPPWTTWWAYTLYAILVAGILLFFRHNILQREKLKNRIRIEAMEYEKKLRMDEMKMRFFANISHEFRTPLTLIMAPLHAIMQTAAQHADKQTSEHAGLIQRNANRLSDLINQLLDIQKLEAKSVRPEICEGDLLHFLRAIYEKFTSLSMQKSIRYEFVCPQSEIRGWFDPDKTDKICTNLLSNAFKFTNNEVRFVVGMEEDGLIVRVQDNGKGIPLAHQERIFERFYSVNDANVRFQEGTGIGLSLVKEMVELLNGRIEVASEEGHDTCFTVHLPLRQASFRDYTIRSEPSQVVGTYIPVHSPDVKSSGESVASGNDPLILIVEDNGDLRKYLRMVLSAKYRICEAVNGEEGLSLAREVIPDLIISDVMMPVMDGIRMAQMLRSDNQTNHIPIVLLTSLVSTDNKLKGLETGVDDYITKPFNEDILQMRIANLIRQRKLLQRFYTSKYRAPELTAVQPAEPEVESADEIFLDKAVAAVEKYMENPGFTNETFSTEMGMSVAVLYRKMNALMNCTPADFIRDLRIKRAVQLLSTGKLHVSEVAGRVGFDDPHYFGKWFKKYYGKTPSEVMPG